MRFAITFIKIWYKKTKHSELTIKQEPYTQCKQLKDFAEKCCLRQVGYDDQRKQLKDFAENLCLRQVGYDDHIVPHKGSVTLICTQILVAYKLK